MCDHCDNNDNQVKGLVSRLDELETELEGERNNRGKAEKSRCQLFNPLIFVGFPQSNLILVSTIGALVVVTVHSTPPTPLFAHNLINL